MPDYHRYKAGKNRAPAGRNGRPERHPVAGYTLYTAGEGRRAGEACGCA